MTYGMALANPLYVALVTDRRMSGAGEGTEDSSKSGVVVFVDARLGYTYSGLGELQGGSRPMETRFWAQEALLEAARPGLPAAKAIDNFRIIATEKFNRLRGVGVSSIDLRFSLLLAGFTPTPLGLLTPEIYLVSNYERYNQPLSKEARRDFSLDAWRVPPDKCQAVPTAVDPPRSELEPVLRLLKSGRVPASEVVEAAVQVIRRRVAPDGTVGPRCSSLIIPRQPGQEMVTDYHPDGSAVTSYLPGFINARYDDSGAFAMVDASLWGEQGNGTPAIMAVPRVAKNHPCPCGSGRNYRRCHGQRR